MFAAGLESLRWLTSIQQSPEGHFVPIGSNGFYTRGGKKARFDQQPVEAYTMLSACLEALRLTEDPFWHREAHRAFEWFLGYNDLRTPLYDSVTGGCRDGLHPDRVNQNQGAESTISFLLSLLEMERVDPHIRTDWENKGRDKEQEPHNLSRSAVSNGVAVPLMK